MKELMDPEDQMVLLPTLRAFFKWDQKDLAASASLDPATVRRYERGERMKRRSYEQVVESTRIEPAFVEACLLPVLRAGRAQIAGTASVRHLGSAGAGLSRDLGEARQAVITALLAELAGGSTAEESWEAKSWRFVEALCHQSEAVASGDAERALKLAGLALRCAERLPGKGERRLKLEGYAWIFIGNAHRVAGSLPGSETAFAEAGRAWRGWQGATPVNLAGWRLPDGKASLRRHQGRFEEALALHDHALALAPLRTAARILLNKAGTLEQQGEPELALRTLDEAEERIDAAREPRYLFAVRFNRIANLIRLKRFEEASRRLPEVQAMAEAAGKPLDLIRVHWLEAKLMAGCGRPAEAVELLDRVRREFLAREIAYDTALVTLELAVLYLEEGRNAEVARLAAELAPLFAAQRVARETLACVRLFCKAAEQEAVTVDLARGWLRELSRAG